MGQALSLRVSVYHAGSATAIEPGAVIDLERLRGTPVLLLLVGAEPQALTDATAHLDEVLAAEVRAHVIIVGSGDASRLDALSDESPWPDGVAPWIITVWDPQAAVSAQFVLEDFPAWVLTDAEGVVRWQGVGTRPADLRSRLVGVTGGDA